MESRGLTRRNFLKVGGGAVFGGCVLGLAGCGNSSQSNQGSKSSDKIDIAVTHYPTVLHTLPYQVGREKGFFQDEGVNIGRIISSSGGGTTVRSVLSGDLAFGDVAGPAAIQSYLAGAPVKIISSTVPSVADSYYVTTKDSPISKPEDLKGHKLAYSNPGSNTQNALLVTLDTLGIDSGSVKTVAAGGLSEGLTLLKKGGVAAAPLLEPVYSAQKGQWKTIYHFSDYAPKFQATALIASPQMTEDNPQLVKSFVGAHQKSVDWIYQNPEESSKIYAKHADVSKEAATSAVQTGVDAKFWDATIYPEAMNKAVKGMRMAGILEQGQEIDWKDLLNQKFLSKDQKVDISKLDANKQ